MGTAITLDYNLEEVSSDFPVLPGATYLAELVKCDMVLSKSSNKPMLKVQWKVMEGEYEGRILFDNVPLHVPFKVKQYAEAAGITKGNEIADTDVFLKTTAVLTVEQKESELEPGTYQNVIKKIVRS